MTSYLTGQEAYDLYKKGRKAWNNWAVKHVGWRVDFGGWDFSNEESLNFRFFHFPGGASFVGATFGDGSVDFSEATFGDGFVDFAGAIFGDGDVKFIRANFGDGGVNFVGATFGDGGVNFGGAIFGDGDVNFIVAKFGDGLVNFAGAIFGDGDVKFIRANFGDGSVNFADATFGKGLVSFVVATFGDDPVIFARTKFGDGDTSFSGASFAGTTTFDDATFSRVPDFRQTHFGRDISMEGMSVAYKQEATSRFLKRAAGSEDASRFRKLRRMAAEAKDHTRELAFFAQETRARYGHDLKKARQYFPFLLYHFFSNFGQSFWRPALGLFLIWILAAEGLYHSRYCMSGARFDAYMLSLSNTMPFLNWGRSVRPDYLTALYGETISQHPTVSVIMYGQGILSLIFIFLIGLALRNKLRL